MSSPSEAAHSAWLADLCVGSRVAILYANGALLGRVSKRRRGQISVEVDGGGFNRYRASDGHVVTRRRYEVERIVSPVDPEYLERLERGRARGLQAQVCNAIYFVWKIADLERILQAIQEASAEPKP